jgi:hypothetical protein
MRIETVLDGGTNGRKSYDFGQRPLFVFHVMQVKLERRSIWAYQTTSFDTALFCATGDRRIK